MVEEKRSEKIINLINPDWNGAVPVTVIYDKKGKRRDFISQPEDYAFFSKKINKIKNELE